MYNKERYSRQLILEGFGNEAQEKLSRARVLVIGAGGLGCPILEYLAAAGIGTIGIADDDRVTYSNLNRQVLYGQKDIGKFKADLAKKALEVLNDEINVIAYTSRWNQDLCIEHFPNYDIIVDATDNFATRYLINDACVLLNKPLVFGAVSKYEGQVAVFNAHGSTRSVNYRDLFPEPPKNDEVRSCSEAGVLGVVPGVIGIMQATEVIKLITGIGKSLSDRLSIYNALTQEIYSVELSRAEQGKASGPETLEQFRQLDYEWLCATESANEMTAKEWLLNREEYLLIDIREPSELPRITQYDHLCIPMAELEQHMAELKDRPIVFICQSGVRSKAAISRIETINANVYSLKGGIDALFKEIQK